MSQTDSEFLEEIAQHVERERERSFGKREAPDPLAVRLRKIALQLQSDQPAWDIWINKLAWRFTLYAERASGDVEDATPRSDGDVHWDRLTGESAGEVLKLAYKQRRDGA